MRTTRREERGPGPPLWLAAAVGSLALGAIRSAQVRSRPAPGAPPSRGIDLADAPARLLVRLPGIGARHSLELVEARWNRAPTDPPLYLADLPGVGADVEGRVRAWLERVNAHR